MNGNSSKLKTNFDIGKVSSLDILNSAQFSLDGLSLALLYATSIYTSKPYSTLVNGQPYNSSTTETSAVDAEIAQVTVGNAKAYDLVFGGNYTLNRGENNETHIVNVETYEAKAEAAAISSLPIKIYGPVVRGISFFHGLLNLTDLFGGSWPDVNTSYNASSLMYRICFPVWDGQQIVHDPVYVGYVFDSSAIPDQSPTQTPNSTPSQTESPAPIPSPTQSASSLPSKTPTETAKLIQDQTFPGELIYGVILVVAVVIFVAAAVLLRKRQHKS